MLFKIRFMLLSGKEKPNKSTSKILAEMKNVKERLLHFLKEEGITASEFSRKMGLSPAYIASMRKSMPTEKVEKLMEVFPQLNRDWLIYGEGDMYRDMGNSEINPHRLDRHMIPLVPAQARAGELEMYAEGYMESDCEKVYSPRTDVSLAIRVVGDSMEPVIHSGTILGIERINQKAFIPWGSHMVVSTENGTVVKMLFPSQKGEEFVEARSYNKDYPPFQIPLDTVYGIYRIICQMTEGFTF